MGMVFHSSLLFPHYPQHVLQSQILFLLTNCPLFLFWGLLFPYCHCQSQLPAAILKALSPAGVSKGCLCLLA
jgi:hypothetical protein